MDCNGEKEPLLSGSLGSVRETRKITSLRRRRFRRCRSALLVDSIPRKANGINPVPHSESLYGDFRLNLGKVAIFLFLYLCVGTFCFYFVRNQIRGKKTNEVIDAVYFTIVTMTTVGYGDLVPNSILTKLLACAFVFTGMALVGLILIKFADYLVEKQEILLVKALHPKESPTEIVKDIETNKLKYKCLLVFVLLLVFIISGTIFLTFVEKLDIVDAFYCVCATITTLGYGDQSFSTSIGRAFAVFWIIMSTIFLAQFYVYVAEINTENRRKALVKWVLSKRVTNLDLEAADFDDDGDVDAADFVIYKLKEMGKITQEDISLVMNEFEDLDVDGSGTLSVSDITLAQSSQLQN